MKISKMIWVISFLGTILLDTILKGTKNLILYILVHKSTKKFKKRFFSVFNFWVLKTSNMARFI